MDQGELIAAVATLLHGQHLKIVLGNGFTTRRDSEQITPLSACHLTVPLYLRLHWTF
jgi:hypothetical protein